MKGIVLYAGAFGLMVHLAVSSVMAARPFLTDDPGINGLGKFEVMAACDSWKDLAIPSIQLRHGITERMDLGVNLGYCFLHGNEKKASSASVNMKFAIVPDLVVASFTGCFGDPGYLANAVVGKSFGPIAVIANIGYSAKTDSADVDFPCFFAVIYEWKKAGFGSEIGANQEGLAWWQFGGRVYITDWLHYDLGIGGDFEKQANNNITTGIDIVFPLDKTQ